MLTRGTPNHSKADFAEQIEGMGATLGGDSGREHQSLKVHCFKGDVSRVVSMLGEAVSSATLDPAEVELAKQELIADHEQDTSEYERTLLENAHYNSYRDHQLGQPIRGDLDSVQNLNADVLNDYRAANFYGDNIVIVGTGGVNHEQFVDQVNNAFNTIAQKTSQPTVGSDKCIYGPALMMIRDD